MPCIVRKPLWKLPTCSWPITCLLRAITCFQGGTEQRCLYAWLFLNKSARWLKKHCWNCWQIWRLLWFSGPNFKGVIVSMWRHASTIVCRFIYNNYNKKASHMYMCIYAVHPNKYAYGLWLVVFQCGLLIVNHNFLLDCHWGNLIIAPVPVE